jgi:hypothetical protein
MLVETLLTESVVVAEDILRLAQLVLVVELVELVEMVYKITMMAIMIGTQEVAEVIVMEVPLVVPEVEVEAAELEVQVLLVPQIQALVVLEEMLELPAAQK